MSEVKRYWMFESSDDRFIPHIEVVQASDYDAAQSELAALREELASTKQVLEATRDARDAEQYVNEELRVKLRAAEQRNAILEGMLRESVEDDAEGPHYLGLDLWTRIHAALAQTTESGASE